jgi:uncharacterized protein (TIGR02145 family)
MKTKFFRMIKFPSFGGLRGGLLLILCPVVLQAQDVIMVDQCASYTIKTVTAATGSELTYKWLENGVEIAGATGADYTNVAGKSQNGEYTYIRLVKSSGCEAWMTSNPFRVIVSGSDGTTFKDFDPCWSAPVGSIWTLRDDRDEKTYVVKKMLDNRIWMVQDLRFGNCSDKSFKTDETEAATLIEPTVYPGMPGHCMASSTANAGFKYNWFAVVNNSSVNYKGCSGTYSGTTYDTYPARCQGICPKGWHVPTIDEFNDLNEKLNGTRWRWLNDNPPNALEMSWFGVASGYFSDGNEQFESNGYYYTSTGGSSGGANVITIQRANYSANLLVSRIGASVRCVRNY